MADNEVKDQEPETEEQKPEAEGQGLEVKEQKPEKAKKKREMSPKARAAFTAFQRIRQAMANGESVDPSSSSEAIKDIYSKFGEEKVSKWIESAKGMKGKRQKKNEPQSQGVEAEVQSPEVKTPEPRVISQQPEMDLSLVKRAVEECIGGQCELLNSLRDDVSKLKSQSAEVSELKQRIESLPDLVGKKTSRDIEGLAKQMLIALKEIRDSSKQVEARTVPKKDKGQKPEAKSQEPDIKKQEPKVEPQPATEAPKGEKGEVPEPKEEPKESKTEPEVVIPLDAALENPDTKAEVLNIIKARVEKDIEFKKELIDLANRCSLGDKEACETIAKSPSTFSIFTHSNPLKELLNG